MDIPQTEIYNTILEIIADKDQITLSEIDEKYITFRTKFPKLYDMTMSFENKNEFLRELLLLLNIREDVITGKKTSIEANIKTGEIVAEKYLYPSVNMRPTEKQKKSALSKILAQHHKDLNETD